MTAYELAREQYAGIGVDTDKIIMALSQIKISIQCWQGDDVKGFLFRDNALSGGIQTTGSYPGCATTPEELRCDLEMALSLIPGKHRVNLHAIYADTAEQPDLDKLEPHHFDSWIDWARENNIGLDFNPTCFSHPMADSGFTLSSADEKTRKFWIEHCRRSRKIAEYIGRQLKEKCVVNFWFPDGYKDIPIDREAPRYRMMTALDEVFSEKLDETCILDALESKVFGIGAESY
ncbi:MAG: L-rhamnose isomerase, partial [Oscillospiraceae bacterium]